jgi:hypothetical protein
MMGNFSWYALEYAKTSKNDSPFTAKSFWRKPMKFLQPRVAVKSTVLLLVGLFMSANVKNKPNDWSSFLLKKY